MEILRKCSRCDETACTMEELEEKFSKRKNRPLGYDYMCKKCNSNRKSAKFFGITIEEYKEAMSTSSYCEICGSTKDLCYDHNHDTGDFRGVLCNHCNRSLGGFMDSEELLLKAIDYLKERGTYDRTKN